MTKWFSITAVPEEGTTADELAEKLAAFADEATTDDFEPEAGGHSGEKASVRIFSARLTTDFPVGETASMLREMAKRAVADDARLLFFIDANDTDDSASGWVYEIEDGAWNEVKAEFTYPDGRGAIGHQLSYGGFRPATR